MEAKPVTEMRAWIWRVIVKYNICPFARKELETDRVRYTVAQAAAIEDVLAELMQELLYLDQHPNTETTLFILPQGFADFAEFLYLTELGNALLAQQNYEGVYQLASFHPNYCFAGEPETDAANYTNRSPFAALHILREASVEEAIDNYEDVDAIPQRNIQFARRKGALFFERLLQDIKKPDS